MTPPEPPALQCPSCSSSWSEPSGRGVALGVDVSGAATALEYQLSVVVPLGWLFAIRARPVFYVGLHGAGTALGGKIEAVFRSRPLWNFVRVYAGGGPDVFYGLTGPSARDVDGNWFAGQIDGNWFAGAEIFFDPRWSLHWELGTSGGAFDTGAGAYADVGLLAYLF
ncbi:MAG TPA: hypothetical protein VIH93_07390 [Thermoanaerobaculia bacterium]